MESAVSEQPRQEAAADMEALVAWTNTITPQIREIAEGIEQAFTGLAAAMQPMVQHWYRATLPMMLRLNRDLRAQRLGERRLRRARRLLSQREARRIAMRPA